MATHHGKDGTVKVGANAVAEVQQFTVTSNAETVEDTAMGDSWKTHLVGVKGWTGSLQCSWDETDTNGQEALTEGASVTLNLYPEGADTGDKYLTGTALVTEITVETQRAGVVTRGFNFLGAGALAWATA